MKKSILRDGFTLIELVLVIAILITLSTVALYNSSISENFKAKKDVDMIYRDIKYTRNLAISNKIASKLIFNTDNSYTISCGEYSETKYYSDKITFKSTNLNVIKYTSQGTPSTSGTIRLSVLGKNYRITVIPVTGKVNIYKGEDKIE